MHSMQELSRAVSEESHSSYHVDRAISVRLAPDGQSENSNSF